MLGNGILSAEGEFSLPPTTTLVELKLIVLLGPSRPLRRRPQASEKVSHLLNLFPQKIPDTVLAFLSRLFRIMLPSFSAASMRPLVPLFFDKAFELKDKILQAASEDPNVVEKTGEGQVDVMLWIGR